MGWRREQEPAHQLLALNNTAESSSARVFAPVLGASFLCITANP
jgi:hypothetical protein